MTRFRLFSPLEEFASGIRVPGFTLTPRAAPELPAAIRPLLLDRLQVGGFAVTRTQRGRGGFLHQALPRLRRLEKLKRKLMFG